MVLPKKWLWRRRKFRLESDHHHLTLSYRCCKTRNWKIQAEAHHERLTDAVLSNWLSQIPHIKNASLELCLQEDLCQFFTLHLAEEWQIKVNFPEFLAEVWSELHLSEEPSDFLIDAKLAEDQCEIVLLPRAFVQMYLDAFKLCRMKVQSIAPMGRDEFNLLPWRNQLSRKQTLKKYLRVMTLPLFAFTVCQFIKHTEGHGLQKLQTQNHNLTRQLHLTDAVQSSYPLEQGVLLLQGILNQNLSKVDSISLNNQGVLNITGITEQPILLEVLLKRFANLPQIKQDSMQDWKVLETKEGQAWSVHFQMQGGSA